MHWLQEFIQLVNLVLQAIKIAIECCNAKHQKYKPKHFGNKKGRHF